MKVLLIVPPVVYRRQPSIGLAYLSAYLKANSIEDVSIWDLNTEVSGINDGDDGFWALEKNSENFIENNKDMFYRWRDRIIDHSPDIVGMNLWSTSRIPALYLAGLIKEVSPSTLIVLGGPEVVLGDNMFRGKSSFDVLVRGEGENSFLELIREYEKEGMISHCPGCLIYKDGEFVDCGKRKEIEDLDSLPFPDYSDFKLDKYLFKGHIPISFSRGCKWRCSFCTVENCWTKFRSRSASSIFKEMQHRLLTMQVKQFVNCDPALNQDLVMLSELCDMLIASGLKTRWDGMAQIRPEMDLDYLRKMKKAGCVLLNYGIESASQPVLDCMGKKYTVSEAGEVIKNTYEAGINVVLNFIVGHPNESLENFNETLEFIRSIRKYVLNIAHGHPCLVVPYNKLYRNPDKYGIVFSIEDSYNWVSKDGKNNARERERRAELFENFLNDLEIEARCGQDDRPNMEK